MDFTTSIQQWYRQNKRELPWRSTKDPYKIWLSEIILQQTRIEQGTPYYLKFINAYPNVKLLAKASEKEVLQLWTGLGYYSRARNLHHAAQTIASEYKGKFPNTYEEIKKLKGIGDYTAAAIASIAFNIPEAVVDGNVYRVISRLFKIDQPIDSNEGKKIFRKTAQELIDLKNPSDHNQAMMELGSLICTPTQPKCNQCPVSDKCLSLADSTQLQYPVKSKKLKVQNRYLNYLVVTDGKKVVLKERTEKDIWKGLYDFRLIEGKKSEKEIISEIKKLSPETYIKDGNIKHILSHQKLYVTFWLVKVKKLTPEKNEVKIKKTDIAHYPIPALLIRYLEQSHLLHT